MLDGDSSRPREGLGHLELNGGLDRSRAPGGDSGQPGIESGCQMETLVGLRRVQGARWRLRQACGTGQRIKQAWDQNWLPESLCQAEDQFAATGRDSGGFRALSGD